MTEAARRSAVPLGAVLIGIGIHTLWGANPIAVKFGLWVFPPMWSGFFRFLLGSLFVAAFALVIRVRIWPRPGEWRPLMVIGTMLAVQIAIMNLGFERTTASMGAVLISTNPLFAALVAHFVLPGDRFTPARVAGLTLAFAGAAAIAARGGVAGDATTAGNALVLASAALLGVRLIYSAGLLHQIDELRVALWQMLLSLPLFAAAGLAFETIAWENLAWEPVAGLLYQGVVIAGVGFTASFYLMKRYPPSIIVSFSFVSPVAGVALSIWLLSERIDAVIVGGVLSVAAGLYLMTRSR